MTGVTCEVPRRVRTLGKSPEGFQAERSEIRVLDQLRGRVGPTSWSRTTSLWPCQFDQRGLKMSVVISSRKGCGGRGKENGKGGRTFGARGGGGVLERATRAGSPPASQRHNSICFDRSSLRRDYQPLNRKTNCLRAAGFDFHPSYYFLNLGVGTTGKIALVRTPS